MKPVTNLDPNVCGPCSRGVHRMCAGLSPTGGCLCTATARCKRNARLYAPDPKDAA